MGEKKARLATGRVQLLREALERIQNVKHFDSTCLLTEVLGLVGSVKFEKYKSAFTINELAFMSVVLDRSSLPYCDISPVMLYRYRHYRLKLYRSCLHKLAIHSLSDILSGLSKHLKSAANLVDNDLSTLGIIGDHVIDGNGSVSLWVYCQDGKNGVPFDKDYSEKLPYHINTSLEQLFHAAEFKRSLKQV